MAMPNLKLRYLMVALTWIT